MFGRKVLFLAAGYIAGNVVSSLYSNKKGKELQADVKKAKKGGNETEVLFSSFLETQKNFFDGIQKLVPKEHQKTLEKKKKEAVKVWEKVKKDGKQMLEQLEKTSKK